MMMAMEKRVLAVLFCVAAWSYVASITVNIPDPVYNVTRGDDITIPCTFKSTITSPKQVIITWSAGKTVILAYYYPTRETDVTQMYKGRASLDLNFAAGKADLQLKSVSVQDNADYKCRIQIPHDYMGQPVDTAQLIVLVAPSPPICKIQGKAEYGENINLTCVSEEGFPAPTYTWHFRHNIPHSLDPGTTDNEGVLFLFNISATTSGYYNCTSSNSINSTTCILTLTVTQGKINPFASIPVGFTVKIVSSLIGLLLVITTIFCCWRKNEEGKRAICRGES